MRAQSASRARSACFGGVEEFVRALDRALETARTKVILPPFHQRSLELDRENFFHDRNVLVQELLLQVDRVRRDDRLLLFLEGEKRRGHEIGERLAHAGAGFDDEMALLFQRLRDRRGHLLLLRPIFEIPRLREQAVSVQKSPGPARQNRCRGNL